MIDADEYIARYNELASQFETLRGLAPGPGDNFTAWLAPMELGIYQLERLAQQVESGMVELSQRIDDLRVELAGMVSEIDTLASLEANIDALRVVAGELVNSI
jgi:hypothetical protein